MSAPDYIGVVFRRAVPLRYDGFPHGLALLPAGMMLADIGAPSHRTAAVYLVDPDCAGRALNDAAIDAYVRAKTPVLVFAARGRDLRPFLRRAPQFRARGYTVEAIARGHA